MKHGSNVVPRESAMLLGEVGETLELVGVVVTIFSSLAILVALGKFWEA